MNMRGSSSKTRSGPYCATNNTGSVASENIVAFLRREGYPDVSDLLGGYQAWTALTQPVAYSLRRPDV